MAFTPYGYNPYYPPPMQDNLMQMRQQFQPPVQSAPAPQNPVAQGGVQWVSGEQEARGYLIAPNSAVALWDANAPTVYLKQADASGKPSLKIYDLVERMSNPPAQVAAPQTAAVTPGVDYAPRSELEALTRQVADLKAQVAALSDKKAGGEEAVKHG